MIRIVLQYMVALLAPSVIYFIWLKLARRHRLKGDTGWWEQGPWLWLFAAGVVLMAGLLGYEAFTGGGGPGAAYVAPHMEDGRIVPGTFE